MGKKKGRSKTSRSKKSSSNSRTALSSDSSQVASSSTNADPFPVLDQKMPLVQQRTKVTKREKEAILFMKLAEAYHDAFLFLVELGFDNSRVMLAILSAGSWYGQYCSVMLNIIKNSIEHLLCNIKTPKICSDIRDLIVFCMESLILNAQEACPSLSRGDAMLSLIETFPVCVFDSDPKQLRWRDLTEHQLEEILFYRLKSSYKTAISCLVKHGIDKDRVTFAVLSSSDCLGPFDPVTNILLKCLHHFSLISQSEKPISTLPDGYQLLTRSLFGLVSGMQETWQSLCRADAMRHLLAYNLDYCQVLAIPSAMDLVNLIDLLHDLGLDEMSPEPETDEIPVKSDTVAEQDEIEVQSDDAEEITYEMDVDDLFDRVWKLHDLLKQGEEWAQDIVLEAAKTIAGHFSIKIDPINSCSLKASRIKFHRMTQRCQEDIKQIQGKLLSIKQEELRMSNETTKLEEERDRLISDIAIEKLLKEEHDKEIEGWKEAAELRKCVENAKRKRVETEEKIKAVENDISVAKLKLAEEKRLKEEAEKQLKAEEKILVSTKKHLEARWQEVHRKLEMEQKKHNEDKKQLEAEYEALTEGDRQIKSIPGDIMARQMEMEESNLSSHESDAVANRMRSAGETEMELSSAPTTLSSSSNGKEPDLQRPCCVCYSAESSVLNLPCAHMILCADCGAGLKDSIISCYYCGVTVDEIIFVHRV